MVPKRIRSGTFILPPIRQAPVLIFIHGGYWQRNSREFFAVMAEGALAAGSDVAMPGYTLASEPRR